MNKCPSINPWLGGHKATGPQDSQWNQKKATKLSWINSPSKPVLQLKAGGRPWPLQCLLHNQFWSKGNSSWPPCCKQWILLYPRGQHIFNLQMDGQWFLSCIYSILASLSSNRQGLGIIQSPIVAHNALSKSPLDYSNWYHLHLLKCLGVDQKHNELSKLLEK